MTLVTVAGESPLTAPPADGFYLDAYADTAVAPTVCAGGTKVHLGAPRKLTILECRLFSESNANNQFQLSLNLPFDPEVQVYTYVLVVDGNAFRHNSFGSSQKTISHLSFDITGGEIAKKVASYFKTTLILRRHPQHRLLTEFVVMKGSFVPGDDVPVTLRITNIGEDPVTFWSGGRNRGARDSSFVFSGFHNGKPLIDHGTNFNLGGLSFPVTIKPRETWEQPAHLKNWFSFDQAGWYALHGAYHLCFRDPGKSMTTIWEDYVSADFGFQVRDPPADQAKPQK